METGIVKLGDAFKGNADTTAEEMKAYVQKIAEKICEVTGLSVIKIVDHARGAIYFIGETGSENALLAVLNPNNASSFFTTIIISRIAYDWRYWSNQASGASVALLFNSHNIYMKYAKSEDMLIMGFSIGSNVDSVNISASILVDKIICEDKEESIALYWGSGYAYASYNNFLDNTQSTNALFQINRITLPIIPEGRMDL